MKIGSANRFRLSSNVCFCLLFFFLTEESKLKSETCLHVLLKNIYVYIKDVLFNN